MSILKKLVAAAIVTVGALGIVNSANAAMVYANSYQNYNPGLTKAGNALPDDRDNPANAFGASDNKFVSLGFGGSIELGFGTGFGASTMVIETSFGDPDFANYPEQAEVWVQDAIDAVWYLAGTVQVNGGTLSLMGIGNELFSLMRIVDISDADDFKYGHDDGFDIDSVKVVAVAEPAALAVLGFGLMGIGLVARRRRKA